MRKSYKLGFSLIELLIAILLIIVIGSVLFYLITLAVRSFSDLGTAGKKEIETSINLDTLNFDIKHAGYGISTTETSLVISHCNNGTDGDACQLADDVDAVRKKLLLLKETTNIVRSLDEAPTVGFVIWNGSEASAYPEDLSAKILNHPFCVWTGNDRNYIGEGNCDEVNYPSLAVGYPYDNGTACYDTTPYCCRNQYCTGIAYYLTSSGILDKCVKGTYIFRRHTPANDEYVPTLSCVSDWIVWFGIDTNADGKPDRWVNQLPDSSSNALIENNADLKQKLVAMKIYFLVQASDMFEKNYNHCKHAICNDDNTTIVVDTLPGGIEVKLTTPQEVNPHWVHYKWQVVEQTITSFPDIP